MKEGHMAVSLRADRWHRHLCGLSYRGDITDNPLFAYRKKLANTAGPRTFVVAEPRLAQCR